jgi:hypothetical protein
MSTRPCHARARWRLLGAAVIGLLGRGCETPPDNGPRFWQASAVQSPTADAAVPDPVPTPGDLDPVTTSGFGGSVAVGAGGAGGIGGRSGSGGTTVAPGTGGSADTGTGGTAGTSAVDAGAGPSGGASGASGDAGAVIAAGGTACTLSFSVTTAATGLDYSPRNIGAVWIADGGGKFVKSLEVWASRRITHLEHWNAATAAAGRARDTVDAITAATAPKHATHTSKWDCTTAAGAAAARGPYQLCMEMNESNDPPVAYQCVKFDNAGLAFTLRPADTAYFKARVIAYAPK